MSEAPAPQPDPPGALEVVQVDTGRVVGVGTLVFFGIFAVTGIARLSGAGWAPTIWVTTSLAGWLLGLVGLVLVARHRRAGRTR